MQKVSFDNDGGMNCLSTHELSLANKPIKSAEVSMTTIEAWIVRARMICHVVTVTFCFFTVNFYNFFQYMINVLSNLLLVQYGINLHLCILKAQIAYLRWPLRAHTNLILFKTHSCKLILFWTCKGSIKPTYLP